MSIEELTALQGYLKTAFPSEEVSLEETLSERKMALSQALNKAVRVICVSRDSKIQELASCAKSISEFFFKRMILIGEDAVNREDRSIGSFKRTEYQILSEENKPYLNSILSQFDTSLASASLASEIKQSLEKTRENIEAYMARVIISPSLSHICNSALSCSR